MLCMGVWLLCCRKRYTWPVLLPWRRVRRLIAGLSCCRVCTDPVLAGCPAVVCGPPHSAAWCCGVCPPSWWGVVWWCVVPCMVGRGVVARGPQLVGRGVVVCGTPHGGACSGSEWPRAWWGLLRWIAVCRVVWRCVLWWCMSPSWWGVLRWCVAPLMVGRGVLCCGAPLCSVLCCGVVRCLVGRAALVCGPPLGGVCCVRVQCIVLCGVVCCGGVGPPSWWGVMWWCVAPFMVGRPVLCCVALHCCVLC